MGARQSMQEEEAAARSLPSNANGSAGAGGVPNSHGRLSARQSRSLSMPSSRRVGDLSSSVAGAESSDSSGDERDLNRLLNALSFERLLRFTPSTNVGPSTSAGGSSANGSAGSSGLPFAFLSASQPPQQSHAAVESSSRARTKHTQLFPFFDVKCPVCNKTVPSDEAEMHLVLCFTRPKLTYNEDTLDEDRGECVICFEDLRAGHNIARLPCLCVYHKSCIDTWFKVKNTCPEHPGEE